MTRRIESFDRTAFIFKIIMVASILLLTPTSAQMDIDNVYHVEDEEDDVVYVVILGSRYRKGENIEDIDITSVDGYIENGFMNFTLRVQGDIQKDDMYDYHISGDLDPYDDIGVEFMISMEYGHVSIFFTKNHTTMDLTNLTVISGGQMNVSVPFYSPSYSVLFYLRAISYYFDQGKWRSYMDDTEPIENDIDETKLKLYQLIGIIILVIGISMILYVIFGKHKFRFFSIGGKRKCPECGVIFTKRTKWCPYCEIPLDK